MIKLEIADCVLLSGEGVSSRGIEWFTDSKYSHAAIYVGDGKVIESTKAGVEKNKLHTLLKRADEYCIRRIPNLSLSQKRLIKNKAYSLLYTDYDTLQLISYIPYFILRKIGVDLPWLIFNKKSKMICSELYVVCVMAGGVKLCSDNNIKKITPATLYRTNKMITIIEEKIEKDSFFKKLSKKLTRR